MRVFCSAIFTETNTFSPLPTSLQNFLDGILFQGPAEDAPPLVVLGSPWLQWRHLCATRGMDYRQGLIAFAEPAGLLTGPTLEDLLSRLLSDLAASMPCDIVLLNLHGSMMAESCDDVEGLIIQKVRRIVGESVVIAVLIDPHAHLTQRMLDHASLIAAFHEWPHTDVEERAKHLFDLAVKITSRTIRPAYGVHDCRMLAAFPTQPQPMRGFVDKLKGLETSGEVLSASFIHGFPWGDNPDAGAKMLVWTQENSADAELRAKHLGSSLFDLRNDITLRADFDLDEAITYVQNAEHGPIVLCDAGDNVPGGGAGDSTYFLSRLLERKVGDICLGPLWDPMATAVCFAAGEGAEINLRIGGKSGPQAGNPVDVLAKVKRLIAADGPKQAGKRFGDRVWVEISESIDVILHSRRATLTNPAVIAEFGIDLNQRRGFVGKMLMHGGAAFAALGAEVRSVATPGTLDMRYESIPLTRRMAPWWPKNADPFN